MQNVAEYISVQIEKSHLKQYEISKQVGWNRPNFLSILKKGGARLPLDKVAPLADALGINKQDLMIRCLREYQPEVLEVLPLRFPPNITHTAPAK